MYNLSFIISYLQFEITVILSHMKFTKHNSFLHTLRRTSATHLSVDNIQCSTYTTPVYRHTFTAAGSVGLWLRNHTNVSFDLMTRNVYDLIM